MEIRSESDTDPFECIIFDVEETYPTLHLLDSGHDEESDNEIV